MINLEFITNTISLGSLYAMLALGLVIVYGILRLVNFAYGELVMVGGYTMYLLTGHGDLDDNLRMLTNGYVQMPGFRCLAGAANGRRWYDVNRNSAVTPNGSGQEDVIREIWAR